MPVFPTHWPTAMKLRLRLVRQFSKCFLDDVADFIRRPAKLFLLLAIAICSHCFRNTIHWGLLIAFEYPVNTELRVEALEEVCPQRQCHRARYYLPIRSDCTFF